MTDWDDYLATQVVPVCEVCLGLNEDCLCIATVESLVDAVMITDVQDIKHILENYDQTSVYEDWGCLFAILDESGTDYKEVWASERSFPSSSHEVYRIHK